MAATGKRIAEVGLLTTRIRRRGGICRTAQDAAVPWLERYFVERRECHVSAASLAHKIGCGCMRAKRNVEWARGPFKWRHAEGEDGHLFAPLGLLDDTCSPQLLGLWEEFSPAGPRLLPCGDSTTEGRNPISCRRQERLRYSRLPQYYKWTTTMEEHQLFLRLAGNRRMWIVSRCCGGGAKKPAAVRLQWKSTALGEFDGEKIDICEHAADGRGLGSARMCGWRDLPAGGAAMGYALALSGGLPGIFDPCEQRRRQRKAARALDPGWHHIAGPTAKRGSCFSMDKMSAETKAPGLIRGTEAKAHPWSCGGWFASRR